MTEDLADFSYENLLVLERLIVAYRDTDTLPKDFINDDVKPVFDKRSDMTFLQNSHDWLITLNKNQNSELQSFYICKGCYKKGFWDDIKDHASIAAPECQQWIEDVAKRRR